MFRWGFVAACAVATVCGLPSAHAAVVSVFGGGTTNLSAEIVVPPPGTNLNNNNYTSHLVRGFNERHGVVFSGTVNTVVSGLGAGAFVRGDNGPAGTLTGTFNSHMIHFDRIGGGSPVDVIVGGTFNDAQGSFTFDSEIVGLIFGNAILNGTDGIFGLGGLTYPTGGGAIDRGLEGDDRIWLSADRRTLFYDLQIAGPFDTLRVLTTPVPEPATCVLFAGVIVGGAVIARRRVKAVTV